MLKRPFSAATLAVVAVAFLLLFSIDASAGVTGKMSGVVYDAASGQPVEGATVRVTGTNFTTKTDMDGEFFIVNVPSGKYDVSISFVGYESVTKSGVRILVDLTTPVDFELSSAPIALDQRVVVSATNPIIQRDLTSSRVIFTSDRLETLPNIITIQSVLTNYPGVVVDADDRMHVRGGRSGQISYYFDGFLVQDPFVNRSGIHIIPSALEELSLTSGGYTAEYGEALSGVVNAVTREGGPEYHGSVKIYEGFTHAYDRFNADWSNLKRVGNRSASFDLSGPIPGMNPEKITFSTSAEYLNSPTSLPHSGSISKTGVAKITARPTPRLKIKTNISYHNQYGDLYEHRDVNGRSYDFNLNGLPKFERESYLIGVTEDYNFSDNMILSASVSRFHTETKSAPDGLMDTYWTEWPGYSVDSTGVYNGTIDNDNYLGSSVYDNSNPYHLTLFTTGTDFDPSYRYRRTEYSSFNVSLLSQINKTNQIKGGIEYRSYDVKWDFKQFFNDQPYGEKYTSKPVYASAYLQDKMEYRDFVMNFGVRYDYHDADVSFYSRPNVSTAFWKKAESKARFSPRLGVSFPISEKSVMHFNYGVYYQEPRYSYMYTNLQGDISSGFPLLGNPDLEPERTVSYELGLDHLIGDDLRLDITAYYKDVNDLVTTRSTYKVAGNAVTFFDNNDYGSVKGIDVAIEKLPVMDYLSSSIAYSYMVAAGNGSDALEPYYTFLTSAEDTLAPVSEYALDFDQRHTVSAVLDYRVPADWQGSLFGIPLPGNWGINMIGHYGSGLPYTPTVRTGERLGERNESRLPAYYTVDMRLNKDFFVRAGMYRLSLFVEADNLFNRRNVINVYSQTGQPNNDGFSVGAGASLDQAELDRLDRLYDHDPQNYSAPRTIRTGMKLSF